MMKRFLLFILFTATILSNGVSQNFIEIGDGTVSNSRPFYSSWNYSWSSLIYKHAELGDSKSITKIAFDVIGSAKTLTNQKIYMKHTAVSEFSDANYEDPENNGYTLVYSGDITFTEGWTEIELDASFDYNGTDNLIIHVENSWGQSYGPNFNSTTSTINDNKSQGSDTGFPTTSGYLNPYPGSLANIRIYYPSSAPATPVNPLPNNNKIKVDLDTSLTFTLGTNTESYDVYFGNDQTALNKVVDNATALEGENTYSISSLLEPSTKYFWKVVAKNTTEQEESPVWNFTTQEAINDFPWKEGFQEVVESSYDDTYYSAIINTNYKDSTDWKWEGSWGISSEPNAQEDTLALYCSPWSDGNYWLQTPRILLPANQRVSFWWKNGDLIDDSKTAGNDSTFFQITTDGGQTWFDLDTLSPVEPMTEWENSIIDLSAYVGNNVYLRWYFKVNNQLTNVKLFIDNLEINEIPSGAKLELSELTYDFDDVCIFGQQKFELIIRNTGVADMVISDISSDGPFECSYQGTIQPGKADTTYVYFKPLEATTFNNELTITTNGAEGDNTISLSGTGLELLNEFYETFDAAKEFPQGWGHIDSPNGYVSGGGAEIISSTYDVYSQPYAAKIMIANDTISPAMLITPGVNNYNTHRLTFYAKKASSFYDLDMVVGTLTDPTDPNTFVPAKTIELSDEFRCDTITFKPTNKAPYIAFKHGGSSGSDSYTSIRIDNIAWEQDVETVPLAANLVSPEQNATDVDIMKNLILKWTAGSSNTDSYKVYLGTSDGNFDIVNGETVGNNPTAYEIDAELTYNTQYFWKIVAENNIGSSEENQVGSFTTMEDPTITEFPWNENFDNTPNTSGSYDCPIGWSMDDANKDKNTWDLLVDNGSYTFSHSAPNSMHVAFGFQPKDDYLYTPPLELKAGNTYKLSFWLHTDVDMVTGQIYKEKIKVFLGNDNLVSAMQTELVSDSVKQVEYKEVTAEFTVEEDDIYYLGFYAWSDAFMYLLIIDDVKLEVLNPEFTSVPVLTAEVNSSYVYNIITADQQEESVSITAPEIPSWLQLSDNNDGTAMLTGTPDQAGDYNVILKASDGTYEINQEFSISVTGTNSINDLDNNDLMLIMPNPAKEYAVIKIDDQKFLPCQLQVYNIIGELVHMSFIDNCEYRLELNSMDSGLYFIKIVNGSEEIVQKLLVR